jgi:hypothetical protein
MENLSEALFMDYGNSILKEDSGYSIVLILKEKK